MNALTLIAIITLAALIHASFQLGISMLTLLSGHALGARARHSKVMNLVGSFTLGAIVMTTLLLCATAYLVFAMYGTFAPPFAWSIACGIMAGVGVAVWVFYYRSNTGTALWVPRPMAAMLYSRIKATEFATEAFSLGLTGVLAEIIFIIAPLIAASYSLVQLPHYLQIVGIIIYVLIASTPLLIITALIGGGHPISRIQKWREQNKRFLQVAAGSALFILGFFIYINAVLAPMWLKGVL